MVYRIEVVTITAQHKETAEKQAKHLSGQWVFQPNFEDEIPFI